MREIKTAWHSFYPEWNPPRGRWDCLWLERILAGTEHQVPYGYTFVDTPYDEVIEQGGVLVLPVGAYAEHGETDRVLAKLARDLRRMPWGVVFSTSDECDKFPWRKIDPWPERVQLYVQLPRPEHDYPEGTRFFGEGSPVAATEIHPGALTRDLDVYLQAQGGHERRDQCFDAMEQLDGLNTKIVRTDGFTQGVEQWKYLFDMTRAWVAPAPSGICSPSSFRAFEALECGAIPLIDTRRPGDTTSDRNDNYWWNLDGGPPFPSFAVQVTDWADAPDLIDAVLADRCWTAAASSSGWQRYKREFIHRIHDDVMTRGLGLEYRFADGEPHDQITVIVVTSPVPSNPSTNMITDVIESIRIDLPGAEILIGCDGVREEQQDRAADYHVFLQRLTEWCLWHHNVTPFVFDEHLHQSGMMRRLLDEVRTEYIMFVEHDCPIVAPVPYTEILETMRFRRLNSVRLMHEASVLPEHEHLFFDAYPDDPAPWRETVQWSQRPHVARTDWYVSIMSHYFGAEARTMIEDVMHGVVQHGHPYATRKRQSKALERWRMGVYAPEGSMKRSGHLDGRAGEPKFPMKIAYDNGRPDGAPPEGMIE